MPELEVAESLDAAAIVEAPVDSPEVVEAPVIETPEGQEEVQTDVEQPDGEAKPEGQEEAGVPAKYKDLFAKDKDLRYAYMGYKALRKDFPGGVKEAREYRTIVNEVGGQEGIQALQADRQAIAAMDEQLMAGDPKFIASIAEEFGEGFVKLMPHALETFFQKDPAGYSHVIGRVVFNTLENSPLGEIYETLKADKPEAAQKLASWYNGIKDLASKVPERKIDPERKKLDEERSAFEQQKSDEFKTSVVSEIRTSNAKVLDTEMGKIFAANKRDYAAFKKTNPEGAATMLQKAYEYMLAEVNKDQTFVKQHNQLLEGKQRDKLVNAMKSKCEKPSAEAVKKAYRLFNFGTAPKQQVAAGNGGGNPSSVKIAAQPKPDQIDWSRYSSDDQYQSMIFKNQAYIKGRKELVQWG